MQYTVNYCIGANIAIVIATSILMFRSIVINVLQCFCVKQVYIMYKCSCFCGLSTEEEVPPLFVSACHNVKIYTVYL